MIKFCYWYLLIFFVLVGHHYEHKGKEAFAVMFCMFHEWIDELGKKKSTTTGGNRGKCNLVTAFFLLLEMTNKCVTRVYNILLPEDAIVSNAFLAAA